MYKMLKCYQQLVFLLFSFSPLHVCWCLWFRCSSPPRWQQQLLSQLRSMLLHWMYWQDEVEPLNSTEGLDLMTVSRGSGRARKRRREDDREREREREGRTNQSRGRYDLNFIWTQFQKGVFLIPGNELFIYSLIVSLSLNPSNQLNQKSGFELVWELLS